MWVNIIQMKQGIFEKIILSSAQDPDPAEKLFPSGSAPSVNEQFQTPWPGVPSLES